MTDENAQVVLARRDRTAFAPLFDLYYPRIYRYLLHRTADATRAADLTSETFLAALASLDRFDPDRGSLSAWLYGIATNEYRMASRSSFRKRKALRRLATFTPAEADEFAAIDARVASCTDFVEVQPLLTALPQPQATAITLRFLEDLPYAEVAAAMGVPEPTARSHVHRGLNALRRQLAPRLRAELELALAQGVA